MICNWNRWRIAKALDTGVPLPPDLERHLAACEACREFHGFVGALPQKARSDFNTLLSSPESGDLSTRILGRLDAASPVPAPAKGRRRTVVFASVSTAAALAALLLGFVLLRPPASPDLSQLNPFPELRSAESTLSGFMKNMDSPYRAELESLGSSVSAAAEFFRSFLDINLGTEE